MKRISQIILGLALTAPAFAQAPLSFTTLSAALTVSQTNVCLASGTNVSVPSLGGSNTGSYLMVDTEVMRVAAAGTSSTCFNVVRGQIANEFTGYATPHGNGAKVWVLGQVISTGDPSRPISTSAFLSQRTYQPFYVAATPTLFAVAANTATADVNGTFFISAMEIDQNALFSGACFLQGATITTDKHILYLWDATGTLLANTTLAGTSDNTGTASQYLCISFTSPIALAGPAQFFVGIQGNGTTDTFQSYAAGSHNYPTTSFTGVFGTPKNFATVPTTFTSNVGPFMQLF